MLVIVCIVQVFLRGTATNKSEGSLLTGEMSVFIDGNSLLLQRDVENGAAERAIPRVPRRRHQRHAQDLAGEGQRSRHGALLQDAHR